MKHGLDGPLAAELWRRAATDITIDQAQGSPVAPLTVDALPSRRWQTAMRALDQHSIRA